MKRFTDTSDVLARAQRERSAGFPLTAAFLLRRAAECASSKAERERLWAQWQTCSGSSLSYAAFQRCMAVCEEESVELLATAA